MKNINKITLVLLGIYVQTSSANIFAHFFHTRIFIAHSYRHSYIEAYNDNWADFQLILDEKNLDTLSLSIVQTMSINNLPNPYFFIKIRQGFTDESVFFNFIRDNQKTINYLIATLEQIKVSEDQILTSPGFEYRNKLILWCKKLQRTLPEEE